VSGPGGRKGRGLVGPGNISRMGYARNLIFGMVVTTNKRCKKIMLHVTSFRNSKNFKIEKNTKKITIYKTRPVTATVSIAII